MLVLSRKPGEKILIGQNVTVTIVRIDHNTVRIGIEAPRDMNIVREELREDEELGDGQAITYIDLKLEEHAGDQ
jgi:carbon storage regulator